MNFKGNITLLVTYSNEKIGKYSNTSEIFYPDYLLFPLSAQK
jgi:hypothetical protein